MLVKLYLSLVCGEVFDQITRKGSLHKAAARCRTPKGTPDPQKGGALRY